MFAAVIVEELLLGGLKSDEEHSHDLGYTFENQGASILQS